MAERRFVYYSSNKECGERLLDMCRASHRFQLSRQAELSELRRLEEHDLRGIRHQAMYIHSENSEFSPPPPSRVHRAVPAAVIGQERPTRATGGSDRRLPSALLRSDNAVRALSSPPSASTPLTNSEGDHVLIPFCLLLLKCVYQYCTELYNTLSGMAYRRPLPVELYKPCLSYHSVAR